MCMTGSRWLIVQAIILLGIVGSTNQVSAQLSKIAAYPLSEIFLGQYFETLESENVSELLELYDADFFRRTAKEEWEQGLNQMLSRAGALERWELLSIRVQPVTQRSVVEYLYALTYDVHYRERSTRETFTLKLTPDSMMTIVGHMIVMLDTE